MVSALLKNTHPPPQSGTSCFLVPSEIIPLSGVLGGASNSSARPTKHTNQHPDLGDQLVPARILSVCLLIVKKESFTNELSF